MQLDDPTALALLAADALRRAGIEHALYGGLLLAAYGEARETRDADMAVAGATATEAARALETSGLRTAVALERVRFGGFSLSRVTLVSGVDGSDLNTLDLVEPLSSAYARRALDRVLDSTLRGHFPDPTRHRDGISVSTALRARRVRVHCASLHARGRGPVRQR